MIAASLLIAMILLRWQVLVQFFAVPDYLLPTPIQVLKILQVDAPLLFAQTSTTVSEWILGLGLSVGIGLGLAVACFRWRRVDAVFSPLLLVTQTIPFLAFAPLLLIWFGLGMTPKIILVVLSCAFPIALSLGEGLKKGEQEYRLLVSMLRLRWARALRHIYFPAALPEFFTGFKISASYAFLSTVMAELIGSEGGLGIYLARAQSSYRTDRVMAALLVIVVVSLTTTFAVDRLRRRVIFWTIVKK